MSLDREKEREMELESAMYTNCLLLGLDPAVIGSGNSTPRVGFFRHSNPKLGEQLLYFILSSLRGPVQSAKDFDSVWPIFDSAQSRDFRKVVQGIISDLESLGALPRSNSRVSSLATCCGPRFVELLWQFSLHALREVHRRTFPADVSSNPLPASLTDVAVSHAAALLPVTKARIAVERRRFLKKAEMAVQRQATWSNLSHEMMAEFRGLCAEEAYLQQELDKLHDLRNKAKSEAEMWDDRASGSSQSAHLVSKASHLWESLLSRKRPIEDLIAHREHRYRISGTALLAAMEQSSQTLSGQPGEPPSAPLGDNKHIEGLSITNSNGKMDISLGSSYLQNHDEVKSQAHDRNGRSHPTVDVAEILRRWTHALQRIHKQSLQLAKTNDGDGPELLQSVQDVGTSGHADSLAATVSEHRQHLVSIQVLVNQLKEVAPGIQNSVTKLTEEVNCISSSLPPMNNSSSWSASLMHAQSSGRTMDGTVDEVAQVTRQMSNIQLEKVGASPTLKLPPLFSLTPNSSGKGGNMQKRSTASSQTHHAENLSDCKSHCKQSSSNTIDDLPQENDAAHVLDLKRSVRATALSVPSYNSETSRDSHSEEGSEHFFVPLSSAGLSHLSPQMKQTFLSERLFSEGDASFLSYHTPEYCGSNKFDEPRDVSHELVDGFLSPPLLMETSLLTDCYEDLLAPLSEMDAALMDHLCKSGPCSFTILHQLSYLIWVWNCFGFGIHLS